MIKKIKSIFLCLVNSVFASIYYFSKMLGDDRSKGLALAVLMLYQLLLASLLISIIDSVFGYDITFGIKYKKIYIYIFGFLLIFLNGLYYNSEREKAVMESFYKKSAFKRRLSMLLTFIGIPIIVVIWFQMK